MSVQILDNSASEEQENKQKSKVSDVFLDVDALSLEDKAKLSSLSLKSIQDRNKTLESKIKANQKKELNKSNLEVDSKKDEFVDTQLKTLTDFLTPLGYHDINFIAEGSFGRVYRAKDGLSQDVALKVAHDLPDLNDKLCEEGSIQASLQHPNILKPKDLLCIGKQHVLIMPFLPNGSLDVSQDYSEEEAIRIIEPLLDALVYAHEEKGVLHRDIKDGNVLMKDGKPKLSDFGLAQSIRNLKCSLESLELTEQVAGTVEYMAPEILQGKPASQSSDVYSVGILLYQLLTDRRKNDNRFVHEMKRKGLDEKLQEILLTATADVDERYKSAREFQSALQKLSGRTYVEVIENEEETRKNKDIFGGGKIIYVVKAKNSYNMAIVVYDPVRDKEIKSFKLDCNYLYDMFYNDKSRKVKVLGDFYTEICTKSKSNCVFYSQSILPNAQLFSERKEELLGKIVECRVSDDNLYVLSQTKKGWFKRVYDETWFVSGAGDRKWKEATGVIPPKSNKSTTSPNGKFKLYFSSENNLFIARTDNRDQVIKVVCDVKGYRYAFWTPSEK